DDDRPRILFALRVRRLSAGRSSGGDPCVMGISNRLPRYRGLHEALTAGGDSGSPCLGGRGTLSDVAVKIPGFASARWALLSCALAGSVACSRDADAPKKDGGSGLPMPTSTSSTDARSGTPVKDFCALPGAIVFDEAGRHVVGGGADELPWLTLKNG